MHRTARKLLFLILLGIAGSLAYGLNYQYYSDTELTPFGDRIRLWHGDSLMGPMRTNGQFAIMQDPVFYDYVISGAGDFEHGSGYNPAFLWQIPPIFNAPDFPFPTDAAQIRARAFDQGYFLNPGPGMKAWAQIKHDTLRLRWAQEGADFDTLMYVDVMLEDSANVFFEAPLRVSGTVSTNLVIGASGRIGLENNILYASSVLPEGIPVPGHTERFALVSESEMKVLNTQANGRNDTIHYPFEPPDSLMAHDIALNGIYVALNGSFTFENQNDPDSGYVFCTPPQSGPDDRGTIYLYGSLMQHQRNYLHRSNCGSTGYQKNWRYDNDLRYWNFGLFDSTLRENLVQPASIDFGAVAVGDTAWDTVQVFNDFVPVWLSMIQSSAHFFVRSDSGAPQWEHRIAVGFSPPAAGTFEGSVSADIPYYNSAITVPLSGTSGLWGSDPFIPRPSSLSLSAYPNPFNSRAMIRFSLPTEGEATLVLYDVQGREVETLASAHFDAGEHSISFDGAALGTGLYFARLVTPSRQMTTKLLLIR